MCALLGLHYLFHPSVEWACYFFSWASLVHLLHLYILFFPWACWLLFLPCWPIGLATSFLRLPRPTYFIFTSYPSHEPTGCYSCHVGLLGLLTCFYRSYFFFFPFPLLLGFFYYWAFHKKNGHQQQQNL